MSAAEERFLQLSRLRRRESRRGEGIHSRIGKLALVAGHRRNLAAPAQPGANVVVQTRRAGELVCKSMQVADLLEQRLEVRIIDRHRLHQGTSLLPVSSREQASSPIRATSPGGSSRPEFGPAYALATTSRTSAPSNVTP